MNTYLNATEIADLGTLMRVLNSESQNSLTMEVTVVDGNGEFVGYIRYNHIDATYVFLDDLSVLD